MGYKIGKVYRITKNDDPTINYVGSTFTTLRQRWSNHKASNFCSISEYFNKYGIDKFKIILIKEYEVYVENQKDNKQLKAYEQLWINKFRLKKCCINKRDAFVIINQKKYYEIYKKEILEKQKIYYEINKEKKKEYSRNYTKINKEKLSQKVNCPICNSLIRKDCLKKHQKTKKCLKAL